MGYVDLNTKGGTLGFGNWDFGNNAGPANFGLNTGGGPDRTVVWAIAAAAVIGLLFILRKRT